VIESQEGLDTTNRVATVYRPEYEALSNYDVQKLLLKATRIRYSMAHAASFYETWGLTCSLLKSIQQVETRRLEVGLSGTANDGEVYFRSSSRRENMGLHVPLFVDAHVIISCTFNTGEIITVAGNDS